MKRAIVLIAGGLAALSLVGPAFAQTTAPATTTPAAPADKPAAQKAEPTRHMTASVVSVNADTKSLTVKRGRGKPLTFAVESDPAAHLGDLRAGDRVRISYTKGQKQLLAKEVVKKEPAKSK